MTDWQNIAVIGIGILVLGFSVRWIVRIIRHREEGGCSCCSKTECPHCKTKDPQKRWHTRKQRCNQSKDYSAVWLKPQKIQNRYLIIYFNVPFPAVVHCGYGPRLQFYLPLNSISPECMPKTDIITYKHTLPYASDFSGNHQSASRHSMLNFRPFTPEGVSTFSRSTSADFKSDQVDRSNIYNQIFSGKYLEIRCFSL